MTQESFDLHSHTAVVERLATLIIETLHNERGVHAETAIATSATLVGECVLRAHIANLTDLPPRSTIINEDVNRSLFEGEQKFTVSDVFINALFSQGLSVSTESWAENIPDQHRLIMDPLEVLARIRPKIEDFFASAEIFEMLERAYVAASVTAFIVAQTRKVLDPAIGKTLALDAILRGAKTTPILTSSLPEKSNMQ